MATLQEVIVARIKDSATLVSLGIAPPVLPEAEGGLGFRDAYPFYITPSSAPDAYHEATGAILPNIGVEMATGNPHPSPHVPGWDKWDRFPNVYLYQYKGSGAKQKLEAGALAVKDALEHAAWQPVITGGQLPSLQWDNETYIDDDNQFPGNLVIVLRFRATGVRAVAGF